MCGIIGYVGGREAPPVLVNGLKHLEYRGYDSCGIGVLSGAGPIVRRVVGGVDNLEQSLEDYPVPNATPGCGIGHTRWATHGRPVEINAHPHCDCSGNLLVVHNGIIENHTQLRERLRAQGHRFRTETDTEVLPHLIESYFKGSLEEAVLEALREVEGMYAVAVLSNHDGGKLVAARRGPPLVVGCGTGENLIASDVAALLPYTRKVLFVGDHELAVVRRDSVDVTDLNGARRRRSCEIVSLSAEMVGKNGYPHFMLKEIHEQPRAVRDTLEGRVEADGRLTMDQELPDGVFKRASRLHLVACGTSLHAAHVGKFFLDSMAGIPVEVDYASEFRYRKHRLTRQDVVLAISQSGETADTLGAVEEARRLGARVLSITNVAGSSLARASDGVLCTRAGPEIGVASTKAFTTQLIALCLLALLAAKRRRVLSRSEIRRGPCFPIAMEGALKLKEISYIHAEAYPAGEMKHGPIALIDANAPVVVLAPANAAYGKTLSNIEEVKGRGARVLAVVTDGDREVSQRADLVTCIPPAHPLLAPLLGVIPLQLFAYYMAVARGCNVDKPRNLAKTVTVE